MECPAFNSHNTPLTCKVKIQTVEILTPHSLTQSRSILWWLFCETNPQNPFIGPTIAVTESKCQEFFCWTCLTIAHNTEEHNADASRNKIKQLLWGHRLHTHLFYRSSHLRLLNPRQNLSWFVFWDSMGMGCEENFACIQVIFQQQMIMYPCIKFLNGLPSAIEFPCPANCATCATALSQTNRWPFAEEI